MAQLTAAHPLPRQGALRGKCAPRVATTVVKVTRGNPPDVLTGTGTGGEERRVCLAHVLERGTMRRMKSSSCKQPSPGWRPPSASSGSGGDGGAGRGSAARERQVERENAQPGRESSREDAKAALGFNEQQQEPHEGGEALRDAAPARGTRRWRHRDELVPPMPWRGDNS